MSLRNKHRSFYLPYLILTGVWFLVVLLIGPQGDFAVNDDWAYAHNLQALTQQGVFYFSDYPAMTLVGQTILAAPAVLLFGFSFTVLRMLTLVLMLGTTWWFYSLLKKLGSSTQQSVISTLMVMGSAMFLSLAFSFMTEWYYLFLMMGSLWYFFRYWETKKWYLLLLAVVFAGVTILVRQTGLLLILAFAFTQFILQPKSIKNTIIAGLPVIGGLAILLAYKYFRLSTGSDMGSYSRLSTIYIALTSNTPIYYFNRIGLIVLYVGCFTIPAFPIYLKNCFNYSGNKALPIVIVIVLTIAVFSVWDLFPTGNLFYNFGLGPHLLKDAVFRVNLPFALTGPLLLFLKIVFLLNGLAAACFLYVKFSDLKKRGQKNVSARRNFEIFLFVLIGAELAYLLINPVFFDRYLIPALLILFLLIGMSIKLRRISLLYPLLLLVFVLNIGMMRDYMNWHRARHEASTYLMNELGVDPGHIDGGYEFNGWLRTAPITANVSDPNEKSWWFVKDDSYLIASGPYPGYHVLKRFPANQWINQNYNEVFVLKKD